MTHLRNCELYICLNKSCNCRACLTGNLRFSWYCARQCHREHQQIKEMASIYHGATATIIALAGKNAENPFHGLPARLVLLRRQTWKSLLGPTKDTNETKPRQLRDLTLSSTYGTRGWTCQERLLPRQCIIFTKEQVFFHFGTTV